MQGKLTVKQLENAILSHLQFRHPQVLKRSGVGEDCAVIKCGDQAVVLSTDPITGAATDIGQLAVNINLNDLAANGCTPIGIMLTIMAAPNTPLEQIERIIADAAQLAQSHGVEIIGGHTEWTDAVNRLVVSAVAVGTQPLDKALPLTPIQAGDVLLLTKSVGLEGTGIIAGEHSAELRVQLGDAVVDEAIDLLAQTSVVKEGLIAAAFDIKAMHDVTEGGLLGGVWEMCHGAKIGCVINAAAIPVHSTTAKICDYYGIDPLRLIASGSLLIAISPKEAEKLMQALDAAAIAVQQIGVFDDSAEKLIYDEGEFFEIPEPEGDALYEINQNDEVKK